MRQLGTYKTAKSSGVGRTTSKGTTSSRAANAILSNCEYYGPGFIGTTKVVPLLMFRRAGFAIHYPLSTTHYSFAIA